MNPLINIQRLLFLLVKYIIFVPLALFNRVIEKYRPYKTSLIKNIHDSNTYGVFIETGCGMPLSNLLFSVSGASKTIYMSCSPYSIDYARTEYGITDGLRAISRDYVATLTNKYIPLVDDGVINTIYCASFQVGEHNNIVTHGWISLLHLNSYKFYHVTIRNSLTRSNYISRIGEIGLHLLSSKNLHHIPNNLDVDMVFAFDDGGNFVPDNGTLLLLMNPENVLCFESGSIPKRLEDHCRDQARLIIYKGSFNPPTNAHIDIVESTILTYPGTRTAFMISVSTFDKRIINYDDILRRIEWITSLGYICFINHKGMFQDTIKFFNKYFKKTILIFPVGSDTKERMESKLFKTNSVKIEVFQRTDISSTRVRQALECRDWDTITSLVPPSVLESLKASIIN